MIEFVMNNENQYLDNNSIKICVMSWHTEQQHEGPSHLFTSELKFSKITARFEAIDFIDLLIGNMKNMGKWIDKTMKDWWYKHIKTKTCPFIDYEIYPDQTIFSVGG